MVTGGIDVDGEVRDRQRARRPPLGRIVPGATLAKLRERGVEILAEPFVIEPIGRRLALVKDNGGNVIELGKPVAAEEIVLSGRDARDWRWHRGSGLG